MKSPVGFLLITLILEGPVRTAALPVMPAACVPTEPMPVFGLHSHPPEPMPIVAPDSTRYDRAPIPALVPCYLVDSLRPDSTRQGWPGARDPLSRQPWPTPLWSSDSSGR